MAEPRKELSLAYNYLLFVPIYFILFFFFLVCLVGRVVAAPLGVGLPFLWLSRLVPTWTRAELPVDKCTSLAPSTGITVAGSFNSLPVATARRDHSERRFLPWTNHTMQPVTSACARYDSSCKLAVALDTSSPPSDTGTQTLIILAQMATSTTGRNTKVAKQSRCLHHRHNKFHEWISGCVLCGAPYTGV